MVRKSISEALRKSDSNVVYYSTTMALIEYFWAAICARFRSDDYNWLTFTPDDFVPQRNYLFGNEGFGETFLRDCRLRGLKVIQEDYKIRLQMSHLVHFERFLRETKYYINGRGEITPGPIINDAEMEE